MSEQQYRVSNVHLRACAAMDPETGFLALVDFTVDGVRVEGVPLHHFEDGGLALLLPPVFSYQLRGCPYGPPLPREVLQGIASQVLTAPEIEPQESAS